MQQWKHLQHHAYPVAVLHGTTRSHWKGSLIYTAQTVSHLLVWCHNFLGTGGPQNWECPWLLDNSCSCQLAAAAETVTDPMAVVLYYQYLHHLQQQQQGWYTIVTDAVAASKWTTDHCCCHWCMCTYITANGRVALTLIQGYLSCSFTITIKAEPLHCLSMGLEFQ